MKRKIALISLVFCLTLTALSVAAFAEIAPVTAVKVDFPEPKAGDVISDCVIVSTTPARSEEELVVITQWDMADDAGELTEIPYGEQETRFLAGKSYHLHVGLVLMREGDIYDCKSENVTINGAAAPSDGTVWFPETNVVCVDINFGPLAEAESQPESSAPEASSEASSTAVSTAVSEAASAVSSADVGTPVSEAVTSYPVKAAADEKWETGKTDGLSFTVDVPFEKFNGVKVNGTLLAASDYTAVAGSTVVTLKPGYLEELPAGKYDLTIVFSDGEADAQFEVAAVEKGTMSVWSWIAAAVVLAAAVGVIIVIAAKKKRT